ncbi:MAG: CDP-alcohol phosphatidyltransferase family protein [Proteobacteria bacterium]|nr:CDP-alcohol phosphatidyltransferase family protein [Pseudomonadota bacterium]
MAQQQPPIDPNLITLARLPLAPLAVVFLTMETVTGVVVAAVLALLLELTDLLDGKIARDYNAVSDFGKLFDPFSDAFSRFTLFLGLYAIGVADLWMIMAIFYRDSSVSFFRTVAATRNVVIAARQSGKIKAVVQGVGTQIIFITLVGQEFRPDLPLDTVAWGVMLVVTLVTLWSFVDYFFGSLPVLREAWSDRGEN